MLNTIMKPTTGSCLTCSCVSRFLILQTISSTRRTVKFFLCNEGAPRLKIGFWMLGLRKGEKGGPKRSGCEGMGSVKQVWRKHRIRIIKS
jgi:hypothetical protein